MKAKRWRQKVVGREEWASVIEEAKALRAKEQRSNLKTQMCFMQLKIALRVGGLFLVVTH